MPGMCLTRSEIISRLGTTTCPECGREIEDIGWVYTCIDTVYACGCKDISRHYRLYPCSHYFRVVEYAHHTGRCRAANGI